MFLGCHHGNGSFCRICVQGREEATPNMPGTWDHLAPSPWAGKRNEMWVSSTAVRTEWKGSLESATRTGLNHQVLGQGECLFPRRKAPAGSREAQRETL